MSDPVLPSPDTLIRDLIEQLRSVEGEVAFKRPAVRAAISHLAWRAKERAVFLDMNPAPESTVAVIEIREEPPNGALDVAIAKYDRTFQLFDRAKGRLLRERITRQEMLAALADVTANISLVAGGEIATRAVISRLEEHIPKWHAFLTLPGKPQRRKRRASTRET